VDCLETDALGRMKLTHKGLYERDKMVFDFAKAYELPIVHVLGGGYSRPIEPTVEAYGNTFRAALDIEFPAVS
jgi:acetoin utilization deacetylase AcuC-like enzyme